MILSPDAENWLKTGLCEAILLLCKSGLKFESQFSVDGLLAVTIDRNEVLLVNIREVVDQSDGMNSDGICNNNKQRNNFTGLTNCPKSVDGAGATSATGSVSCSGSRRRKMKVSNRIAVKVDDVDDDDGDDDDIMNNKNNCVQQNNGGDDGLKMNCDDDVATNLNLQSNICNSQGRTFNTNNKCNINLKRTINLVHINNDEDAAGGARYKKEPYNKTKNQPILNSNEFDDNQYSMADIKFVDDDEDGDVENDEFDLSKVKVEDAGDDYDYTNISHNSNNPSVSNSYIHSTTAATNQLLNSNWVNQSERDYNDDLFSSISIGRLKLNKQKATQLLNNLHSNQKQQPQQQMFSYKRRLIRTGCCENCGTTKTTAWRRSESKELLCNACGCYYKLHKIHRPLHMAHNEIRSRTRRVNVNRSMTLTTSMMMSSMDPSNHHHDNHQLLSNHLLNNSHQIVTS